MAVFALKGQARGARRYQLAVGERYREFEFIPLRQRVPVRGDSPFNWPCQIFGSVLVQILVTTVRKSYDPFGTQD
jgi:hypothetical protein